MEIMGLSNRNLWYLFGVDQGSFDLENRCQGFRRNPDTARSCDEELSAEYVRCIQYRSGTARLSKPGGCVVCGFCLALFWLALRDLNLFGLCGLYHIGVESGTFKEGFRRQPKRCKHIQLKDS